MRKKLCFTLKMYLSREIQQHLSPNIFRNLFVFHWRQRSHPKIPTCLLSKQLSGFTRPNIVLLALLSTERKLL